MTQFYEEWGGFMRWPEVAEMAVDVILCAVPIWLAVVIGLVIGWSWRPRWTGLLFLGLQSRLRFLWTAAAGAPPGFGARRLWFAFTALSAFSVCGRVWTLFKRKVSAGGDPTLTGDEEPGASAASVMANVDRCGAGSSSSEGCENEHGIVTENDLDNLLHYLDDKIGDASWQSLMERNAPNMTYQAWRHDPEGGPTVYQSRTVFEDATPELVRDFFWDDEFRLKWDSMLAYFKILEECPDSGIMIVHWIKKFPFFCSDREYIIARRIWESRRNYYCVTKGVSYPSLRKNEKPRRVEHYFSSWRIKAVESRKQDGQLSACEVMLIHYEDMGIPKDVAKVGVRHGMWGAVKKMNSGMRAYQQLRRSESTLSRCATMAHITSKFQTDDPMSLMDAELASANEVTCSDGSRVTEEQRGIDWKWIALGGTVAVVCGLHTGLIGKAIFFGAARRMAKK